jgi:hypothetical protein
MKNRAVILLALLAANDRFGRPEVHRTILVKQAFLAETVRPLYRQWKRIFSFIRYFYGPYSDDIFYRLDILIFNGLVEVTKAERRRGNFEARYKITERGREILSKIDAVDLTQLADDIVWALQTLGIDQAGSICKLVYQESEFCRIFKYQVEKGQGPETKTPLPSITSANNETFTTLAIINELWKRTNSSKKENGSFSIPSRDIVSVFLKNLVSQNMR